MVGTKGIFKVWVRVKPIVRKRDFQGMGFSSLKPIVRKKRAFEGEGDFCCTPRGWGWLIWVFEWECLRLRESVWIERLSERVFELWECLKASDWYIVQISSLINSISTWLNCIDKLGKTSFKSSSSNWSQVLETRDASFTFSFKTGQLTKLLP